MRPGALFGTGLIDIQGSALDRSSHDADAKDVGRGEIRSAESVIYLVHEWPAP